MTEIKNAKITSMHLGQLSERFWGAKICFNYGIVVQCVSFEMEKIQELLTVLEIADWESLPDKCCRVKASPECVFEIGHFIKNQWLKL